MWVGNRIDKLGKMIWSQFSTKALQMNILEIQDWDNIKKKIHLYNKEFTYIIKCMISIKIPQKGRKILNFSQDLPKDKSFQMLSPDIDLRLVQLSI